MGQLQGPGEGGPGIVDRRDVAQPLGEVEERPVVDAGPRELLYGVMGEPPKALIVELVVGGADNLAATGQEALTAELIEGWQQLAPGQVPGRPENDQILIGGILRRGSCGTQRV